MKVPLKIEDVSQKLLDRLNATHDPIFVDVKLEEWAKPLDCINNVKKKIEKDGGKSILGWQIWQNNIADAEFHAVWEDLEGNLVDITPKEGIDIKQIIFVEDSNLKYEGKQIDNVRVNISGNPLVDDLILVSEKNFQFLNNGEKAEGHKLFLTLEEAGYLELLQCIKNDIISMLSKGQNKDNLCFCNSGRSYKDCCGRELGKILNEN